MALAGRPVRTRPLGLNFATELPELFAGKAMNEDALRLPGEYLKLYARLQADVSAEVPLVRAVTRWAVRLQ